MASAIPLALSLLQTVAGSYPGPQKPTTNSAPSTHSSQSTKQSTPSAPLNMPNSQSNSASNQSASVVGSPPSNTASNLCDQCHLRPKYSDGSKTHLYCSKTCAAKARSRGSISSVGSSSSTNSSSNNADNCDFCHTRPKYNDGVQTHPFCSKACANSSRTSPKKTPVKGACQAPGCTKPAHTSSKGSLGAYCSLAHKTSATFISWCRPATDYKSRLAENLCLLCLQAPKMANSHFCGQTCADEAESKGPMVLEVPLGHSTFKSVAEQFKTSWRHGTSCPPVRHVYKIVAPQAALATYNAYRDDVEKRGQFVAAGRSAGNENRRWHGTTRECRLGDKGETQFCASQTCSLCCIVKLSYDLSLFGKKTGWGRFGKGIYTSSTSSKSNDYSRNASSCNSHLKTILLNKVVVGRGAKMLHDSTNLTAPPSGYDSVLAEKGGSLNYDELVVYTNDAIRPSFLVVYEP
ncbi:hypothetical protein AMATHDRAFT_5869 [Amanita thiersii Skay4041]|uniref:PARP catalytic domain-containing protein n=1 Tax=Amanita thiersii Skay4041 TaxID=703135 RepID=A0A2A9NKW1_9AGAR|nr:hypothetical protein AMATHDRAFT_5869 [Amanita thiersii Skay4041]